MSIVLFYWFCSVKSAGVFFIHKKNHKLSLWRNRAVALIVGLSNKLDSELVGRKPVKRSHGQVVGTAIMDGKLLCKIVQ